jgi:hypothetical protein
MSIQELATFTSYTLRICPTYYELQKFCGPVIVCATKKEVKDLLDKEIPF